jgi:hypothetical protein
VTRSTKLLLPVLVAVAAAAAFWFLALSPKREEMVKLDSQIAEEQRNASAADQRAVGYAKAKTNYRVNYTKLARLGKAVPADDDVRSLLVQLDATAKRSKVEFRALNVTGAGAAKPTGTTTAAAGALAPPPGTVSVGSAGFSAMPFTFTFTGSYFRLSDFFRRLEHFVTVQNENIGVTGRLLLLGSIAVTPDSSNPRELQAQIGAAAYLVPPTEGVPGVAQTPAAGTTPASGSGTVPTTATITGVR